MPEPTKVELLVGGADSVPDGGRLIIDVDDCTVGIFRIANKLYSPQQ
ncbi:Uncharacterised protein [Mycobacteroides abscessus subsp. bolletii]|nr:hypothetical protein [Mycobacteroides abscessus]SLI24401.1 Uncharacterised protein [Mycobacteroides abscessus subsp. bolletii]